MEAKVPDVGSDVRLLQTDSVVDFCSVDAQCVVSAFLHPGGTFMLLH